MIEIGGMPILWHIMKLYAEHGINEFIICCGYKGYVIKEYFANYFLHMSDVTFDMRDNQMTVHNKRAEPWKVTLIDTGERLKRVTQYIKDEDTFCFTYRDGVADVDISKTIEFHQQHGKLAFLTATLPPGRFGALNLNNGQVKSFTEKPKGDGALINGGFFILSPKVLDYIENDKTVWEQYPLKQLAEDNQLMAYEHYGFWQPMDTLRDKVHLQELWESGNAPWKVWSDNNA